MVRVVYRWKVQAGEEEIFVRAWTRGTRAIRDTVKGARGSLLLRNQNDPSEYIGIARWDTIEDCRAFWESEPPDAEAFEVASAVSTLLSRTIYDEVLDLTQPVISDDVSVPLTANWETEWAEDLDMIFADRHDTPGIDRAHDAVSYVH